ncbi:hypothetical protein BDP27DRAFT_1228114 [Rhodocollybia butyracea]|uniref:Uncharacterized protein n=1 Tax=Rhodocollybia butyracea TaxID=206335 RepID=A0A9P5PQ41_9AGAR|nr:hypothetical protein BDP27DRAFT_1228114 [Rhodocollybia butyracea]
MCLLFLQKQKLFAELWLCISLTGLFFSLVTHPTAVFAQVQTGYIDDQFGDPRTLLSPVYSTNGNPDWVQNANCTGGCWDLDIQQVFNQTWHGTEFFVGDVERTMKFQFTGTSLNVYCILPNPVISSDNNLTMDEPIISNYNLRFTLDGQSQPEFVHTSDGSGQFQYNFSVLSLSDLSNSQHAFEMAAPTDTNSTILFDYATYE